MKFIKPGENFIKNLSRQYRVGDDLNWKIYFPLPSIL